MKRGGEVGGGCGDGRGVGIFVLLVVCIYFERKCRENEREKICNANYQ